MVSSIVMSSFVIVSLCPEFIYWVLGACYIGEFLSCVGGAMFAQRHWKKEELCKQSGPLVQDDCRTE